MTDDLDPEVKKALDERIEWINTVTGLCRERGAKAIQKPIDEIDDNHLRSMIFVLIIARADDRETLTKALDEYDKRVEALKDQVRDTLRADMNRALDAPDLDTARLRIAELEQIVAEQEQLITTLRWLTGH